MLNTLIRACRIDGVGLNIGDCGLADEAFGLFSSLAIRACSSLSISAAIAAAVGICSEAALGVDFLKTVLHGSSPFALEPIPRKRNQCDAGNDKNAPTKSRESHIALKSGQLSANAITTTPAKMNRNAAKPSSLIWTADVDFEGSPRPQPPIRR